MNRRKAIQQIGFLSAGLILAPACVGDKFGHIKVDFLESESFPFLQQFIQTILPIKDIEWEAPESSLEYVLRVIDDCYSPKEQDQFKEGLEQIEQLLQTNEQKSLKKMTDENFIALVDQIESSNSENALYCLKTVKSRAVEHFTTSQYFQTNHLDYRFEPVPFVACATI